MRQVNPNKSSKEDTTISCRIMIKATHDLIQYHIKHSHLFETSHGTSSITKHTIKITSNMTHQSQAIV